MSERDPIREVLQEWTAAAPSPELDERVLQAYRRANESAWQRFWTFRVSIPLPVLVVAAALLFGLIFWFRSPGPAPGPGGIVTQLDTTGFQPLPHGEARIIAVKDLSK